MAAMRRKHYRELMSVSANHLYIIADLELNFGVFAMRSFLTAMAVVVGMSPLMAASAFAQPIHHHHHHYHHHVRHVVHHVRHR